MPSTHTTDDHVALLPVTSCMPGVWYALAVYMPNCSLHTCVCMFAMYPAVSNIVCSCVHLVCTCSIVVNLQDLCCYAVCSVVRGAVVTKF